MGYIGGMERISENDALTELRASVDAAGGLRPWCRAHGVNSGYLASILGGTIRPGPAVLKPLGLRRVETIERIPHPSQNAA